MMFTKNADGKYTAVHLITKYFGQVRPVDMGEMRALDSTDRNELASAIAREFKLDTAELQFTPVPY